MTGTRSVEKIFRKLYPKVIYLDYFLVILPLVVNRPQGEWVQIMKRNLNFMEVRRTPNIITVIRLPWSKASRRKGILLQI